MSLIWRERHNVASTQEAPQLDLASRSAHLGDDWCRRRRNDAEFETDPVVGPHNAVVPVRGDEHTRVVDNAHAERDRCVETTSSAMRRRAASSSSCVKAPCSFSHSSTPRRPSRTKSARRAAEVIQAETLTPSRAAAAITCACTSASTVIANLGDGFPRGTPLLYYRSRRVMNHVRLSPTLRHDWVSRLAAQRGRHPGYFCERATYSPRRPTRRSPRYDGVYHQGARPGFGPMISTVEKTSAVPRQPFDGHPGFKR